MSKVIGSSEIAKLVRELDRPQLLKSLGIPGENALICDLDGVRPMSLKVMFSSKKMETCGRHFFQARRILLCGAFLPGRIIKSRHQLLDFCK